MNERYLFRGKRKDNGEWAYGGLDTDWGLKPEERDRYWIIQAYLGETLVIPETIGQCTGLKDKNGKFIFVGDIIVTPKFNNPSQKYIVEYDVSIATYIGSYKKYGNLKYFTTFDGDSDCFEVIGNIHDNTPELLEGSE